MLGGYQILDLRKIDLTITKTLSNITDAYVLSQLLKLRDFIDKDYDFSKPIENQLKPVLIRYRDKKSGEKNEGAMFGELAIVDNYYTFQITGRISGYLILTIKVAFQEITNAYGAKEWVINTAKIKLQDVRDDLEGNLALEGDLDVSGDVAVGGDLDVTGDANIFEKIKDASGHARFIEGNGNPLSQEGFASTYCKWSLSGSHLLLVLAGSIEDEVVISDGSVFAQFNLPEWIMNKIYATFGSNIELKTLSLYASDWTTQTTTISFRRASDYSVQFRIEQNLTMTAKRYFRIQCDLLIDNE